MGDGQKRFPPLSEKCSKVHAWAHCEIFAHLSPRAPHIFYLRQSAGGANIQRAPQNAKIFPTIINYFYIRTQRFGVWADSRAGNLCAWPINSGREREVDSLWLDGGGVVGPSEEIDDVWR